MKKKNCNKDRITTNSVRTIKSAFPRFISLLIMSMLGVFVLTGLQSTAPDMKKTLDKFLDKQNTYDIKIVSSMGLTSADLEAIKNIDSVLAAEGSYSKDLLFSTRDDEYVINVASINKNLNNLKLIEGSLPTKNNEIVVEENMLTKNNLNIGDTITLNDASFKEKDVIITGTVTSSLYFSSTKLTQDRGTTSVGTGTISYYSYMLEDNFTADYYTNIYLTIKNAKSLNTFSNEYKSVVEKTRKKLDKLKPVREKSRYDTIKKESLEALSIKEQEANNKLAIIALSKDANIYNETKEKIDQEIALAKEKIANINYPKWYIYDRSDISTYSNYLDDTTSISNISAIFPVVFFLVAILVSLISMNRMVESDRLEIGTLKSLGFSNSLILRKYLLFSFLATIIGGILGSILGLTIIPALIFNIYHLLFAVPNFILGLNLQVVAFSILISIICVCGTTIITVQGVLKEKPADLMRAKAPPNGRRVFLEKIKFIWSRLKFSNKITIRNLFRYKKRVIVTIFGIAGCSALILCGFGIKDSIVNIADMQYKETFNYDALAYLNNPDNLDLSTSFNNDFIKDTTYIESINSNINDIESTIYVASNAETLSNIIKLVDKKSNELIKLQDNKIIITDKLADLANLHVGDKATFTDIDNNEYTYKIQAIVKNYIGHYIYMTKNTFEKTNKSYKPNMVYLKTKKMNSEQEKNLQTELLKTPEIINISFIATHIESVTNMLSSLNKVVFILIVLAAFLAFIVLYNLSNININERKREIASLKVLGFYDKEIDNYITKENIILTIIGIALGLILGYFLTNIVITTVEIEKTRFVHNISLSSYLITAFISCIFTFIVNIVTHFSLKKIDMIESLKSVE